MRSLPSTSFSKRRLVAGGIPDEKVILKPNFVDDPGPRRIDQSPNRSCSLGASPRRRESSSCSRVAARLAPRSPLARHRRRPADVRSTRPPRREHPSAGPAAEGRGQVLMLCSRALVLPSRAYEVQPLVLLEALAATPRARLGPRREPGSARCPGGRMARGTGSRRGLEPRPLTGSRAARSSTRRERARAPHTASGLRPKSAFGISSAPTRVHLTYEPPSVAYPRSPNGRTRPPRRQCHGRGGHGDARGRIPPPLLKGPSIAAWLYGDGAARRYADSDLLVAPGPIDAQGRFFGSSDFTLWGYSWHRDSQTWLRRSDSSNVDLHRSVIGAFAPPDTVWHELAAHTDTLRVGGIDVEVLCLPARAVHVALHAAQHGDTGAPSRIRASAPSRR